MTFEAAYIKIETLSPNAEELSPAPSNSEGVDDDAVRVKQETIFLPESMGVKEEEESPQDEEEMSAESAGGSKRKESMARKREIKQKLMAGEYRITEPDANLKSSIWAVFKPIVDGDGNSVNYVCCVECNELYAHVRGQSGTSHIQRHPCVSNRQVACFEQKCLPEPVQDKITDKCVAMCARDLTSFEAVSGEGFLDLAQTLVDAAAAYGRVSAKSVMPDPTAVARHVLEKAKSLRDEIVPEVMYYVNRGECSATTEMWTCSANRNHYLTCTVSYFVNWNLKSRVLFTALFRDEPKTGDDIRKELLRRFISLGIHENSLKEVPFTTDQGPNIVAALRGYSRLNCSCHMLNTVLRNAFNVQYMSSNCPRLHLVLSAVKELVTFAKQSDLVPNLERTPEQSDDTRWNTRLTVLESVRSQYSTLCEKLSDRGEIDRIEGIEVTLMDELISLLTPFRDASSDLERENSPTLHLVLPWKMTLLKHLTKEPEDGETSEVSLLRIRLKNYVEDTLVIQRHHEIATFLWAPFRHLKMLPESQRREVMAEVKILMGKEASGKTEEMSQTESYQPPVKLHKFALWADTEDSPTSTDELERYLNQNCKWVENVASYWSRNGQMFPTLQKIARKILCIQSSSSASERNFCSSSSILNARRSLLTPDSVDALLFLHSNSNNK